MTWKLVTTVCIAFILVIGLLLENRPAMSDFPCDVIIYLKDWHGRGVEGITVTLEPQGGGTSRYDTTDGGGVAGFDMSDWPNCCDDCGDNEGWYTAYFNDDCDPPNYFEDDVYFDGFEGSLTFNNVNLCTSK